MPPVTKNMALIRVDTNYLLAVDVAYLLAVEETCDNIRAALNYEDTLSDGDLPAGTPDAYLYTLTPLAVVLPTQDNPYLAATEVARRWAANCAREQASYDAGKETEVGPDFLGVFPETPYTPTMLANIQVRWLHLLSDGETFTVTGGLRVKHGPRIYSEPCVRCDPIHHSRARRLAETPEASNA